MARELHLGKLVLTRGGYEDLWLDILLDTDLYPLIEQSEWGLRHSVIQPLRAMAKEVKTR